MGSRLPASLVYGLLYSTTGWRGMLWIGILPVTFLAVDRGMGFLQPMLYGTIIGAVIAVVALVLKPGDKGSAVHVRAAGEVGACR